MVGGAGTTSGSSGNGGGVNDTTPVGCEDFDNDGFPQYCERNAPAALDCDDKDPNVHPGATEVCDGVDNDCNGKIDDGDAAPACPMSCDQVSGACDPAVQIAAVDDTLCYLTQSGQVDCLGENSDGEAASLDFDWPHTPQPVPGVTGATALVSDGRGAFCAIGASDALCWGQSTVIPFHQPLIQDAISYSVNSDFGLCGLTSSGAITCNSLSASLTLSGAPETKSLVTTGATAFDSFGSVTCALLTGGAIQCWGYDDSGFAVDSMPLAGGASTLKVGPQEVCAIVSGDLECWSDSISSGFNGAGTVVPGEGSATALALSADSECGMAASGKVACWNGTHPADPPNASAIAVGRDFGCLLTTDGLVKCWGALDANGVPALVPAGTTPNNGTEVRSIPYLLSNQGSDVKPLHATPALGACDNPDDLGSIGFDTEFNGIVSAVYTCAASCMDSLDPASCISPCYAKANPYAPISNACIACFASYFSCTGADCYDALNSCVGFNPYFSQRTVAKPTDQTAECYDCPDKKHVGEVCTQDQDCRSGKCSSVVGALPTFELCIDD